MLETDALKEKLEMEIHRFARPPEELSSGDPYFEQLQTMLAIREELENIPLCDIQRDMLLAMENVLESAWLFRNTPVPDRCMNPNNISEVVYYFLQDKGAEYRGDLLYERAKPSLMPVWKNSPPCRLKKFLTMPTRRSSKKISSAIWRKGWTSGKRTLCCLIRSLWRLSTRNGWELITPIWI